MNTGKFLSQDEFEDHSSRDPKHGSPTIGACTLVSGKIDEPLNDTRQSRHTRSTPGPRKLAGWGKRKTSTFNQKQAIEQQSDTIAATQIFFCFVLRYSL